MKGRVAIIHPDLGLGGAERLIVDLALALSDSGYRVKIFTAHHDKNRCFQETRNGRLEVESVCSYLPRSTFGKFHALWAYLKVFLIGLYLCIFHRKEYDVFVADQVPSCLPVLKLLCHLEGSKIVYYCHYPDMLLTSRDSAPKKLYRLFIDHFEGFSTSLADLILVNSKFTAAVVRKTFAPLNKRDLKILYPCVNLQDANQRDPSLSDCGDTIRKLHERIQGGSHFKFLSLNRFEPKKDVALAIKALREAMLMMVADDPVDVEPHLIIAGGYDERLSYCVDYLRELTGLVNDLNLESHVTFIRSPSDTEKLMILKMCDAVIYTPTNEHFGIVPLEAMAMNRPVLACNSGGPLETIKHEETGYLSDPSPHSFAKYMCRLMKLEPREMRRMGDECSRHVRSQFTFDKFKLRLELILDSLIDQD